MLIPQAFEIFKEKIVQCDDLVAHAHQIHPVTGEGLLTQRDREQVTVAAFLNMFIAWEEYLESTLCLFLTGSSTMSGAIPGRFASPTDATHAAAMIIGVNRFFDYGNHDNFARVVEIYLEGGRPYQPHLKSIKSALDDIRIIRNASAHVSSTTQKALDNLALRLLGKAGAAVSLYGLLTAPDPRSPAHGTIFQFYKDTLISAADLIAGG